MFAFKHIPQYAIDAATRPETYEFAWEATETVDDFVEDAMLLFDEQFGQAVSFYKRGLHVNGGFDHAAAVGIA